MLTPVMTGDAERKLYEVMSNVCTQLRVCMVAVKVEVRYCPTFGESYIAAVT